MTAVALDEAFAATAAALEAIAATGPDLRVNAALKTVAEAREFAADASLGEAADVLICVFGAAQHRGWTPADLAAAVASKAAELTRRTWVEQPDGTWQHVRQAS